MPARVFWTARYGKVELWWGAEQVSDVSRVNTVWCLCSTLQRILLNALWFNAHTVKNYKMWNWYSKKSKSPDSSANRLLSASSLKPQLNSLTKRRNRIRVRRVPETKIVKKTFELKTGGNRIRDTVRLVPETSESVSDTRPSNRFQLWTVIIRIIIRNLTIIAVIITIESLIKVLWSQKFIRFYEKDLSNWTWPISSAI